MEKEDLKIYTKDELEDMFVNLINEMEKEGNRHMDFYNETADKMNNFDKYSYGGALLTRVNRIKAMVALKKSKYVSN